MENPRTALLIINRRSRKGARSARLAIDFLQEYGVRVVERSPTRREEIPVLICDHAEDADIFVLGGGDGTINAALPALVGTGRTLGILPLGTANNFARTIDIPLGLEEACRLIATGEPRLVDVGQVNDRYFLTTASIGLSVRITDELTGESKRRWGRLAYVIAAARAIRRSRPFTAEVTVGSQRLQTRTVQIVVGNGHFYGAKLRVAEDARIDDQQLDVLSVEISGWWKLLKVFPSMKKGDLEKRDEVLTLRTDELRIETHKPKRINADGEVVSSTPARFRVLPAALRVLAPTT